jgi:hypothetical protein
MRTTKIAKIMRTRYLVAKSSPHQPTPAGLMPALSPPSETHVDEEWLAHVEAGRIEVR